MKEFTLTASDGFPVSCALFESGGLKGPVGPAPGIVQIVHGAKERKERYYDFASFLASHGFHVILSDLRGHGASVSDAYPFGHMDGWEPLVSDLVMISQYARDSFTADGKPLPLNMFAHSFGSVLARLYLQQHDRLLSKLILTGTVRCQSSAGFISAISKAVLCIQDPCASAGFPMKLGEPGAFDPEAAAVKYSNAAVLTVWSANHQMQRTDWTCQNPTLQILSLTGMDDSVPGGEKGLEKTVQFLRARGYQDVRSNVYPDAGHHLIRSRIREKVQDDILSFLGE